MKAVVVANGDLDPRDGRHVAGADLLVAADGGAATLARLGARPAILAGDLDSLDPSLASSLAAAGTRIERAPAAKDETDTELAVQAALRAGADEVVLLAAGRGARLDHELANLLLLADEANSGKLRFVSGTTQVRCVRGGSGPLVLDAGVEDLVSLLPVGGDAEGVTTEGLAFPLRGGRLVLGRARGVSNRVVNAPASVSLERGLLIVVEIRSEQE